MVKLHTFAGNADARHLINVPGRLSDCGDCCCDTGDRYLYLHVRPTGLDGAGLPNPDCQNDDQSEIDANGVGYLFGNKTEDVTHCIDWLNFPVSANAQQCFRGMGSDPFGVGMELYCKYQNEFRADICWNDAGHPINSSSCTELLTDVEPVAYNTCEADPGQFFIDFGTFIPMASTVSSCTCSFRVWVDEDPGNGLSSTAVYQYPAAAAGGHELDQAGPLWGWELTPGVNTPLGPKASLACGVGTRIKRRLTRWGIRIPDDSVCSCNAIQRQMDQCGPVLVMSKFDYWVKEMRASSAQWFSAELGKGPRGWIKQPFRAGTMFIPRLIRTSCEEEAEALGITL